MKKLQKTEINANNSDRNYGIDALRIVSMFFVVVIHVIGHGGIRDVAVGVNQHITWLLTAIVYCAVDVFALISGYVGYTDKPKAFKSAKFISFWTQVFFYSFIITLIVFIVSPEAIGIKALIRSAFPIATSQYWYASCYAALMLLMPWINRLIRSLDNKELTRFVALLAVLFSAYMIFAGRLSEADPFVLNYGYSVIWLTALYIIGAWMKRTNISERISTRNAILIIVICVLISWLFKDIFTGIFQTALFMTYTSPTVLIIAMSYIVIFSKMKVSNLGKRGVITFAPAAFGVFLIHEQPIIREVFMKDGFTWIANAQVLLLVVEVIAYSFFILIAGLIIEKLRLLIFDVLHIDRFLIKIGNNVDSMLEKVTSKICSI